MGRLCTPGPIHDPLTTVYGHSLYNCPDVATVDAHLVALQTRIGLARSLPRLVAIYRHDITKLLDRRLFLMATAPTSSSTATGHTPNP